jgi:2-methylcitrate dehydratase PrpD
VADFSIDDLSDRAIYRSKRMILDSIGVGTIGSQTEIAGKLREFAIETNGINIITWSKNPRIFIMKFEVAKTG